MDVSRETLSLPDILYNKIKQSVYYERLFGDSGPNNIKNCASGFLSLLFSIGALHDKNGFLIIAGPNVSAERLYLDIYDLLPGGVCFAPHIEKKKDQPDFFISEEEKNFESAYAATVSNSAPIIISTEDALNQPVFDPIKDINRVVLKTSAAASMSEIVKKLSLWDYEAVDTTSSPRSYSVRGGILDVFPLYSSAPVRVEFFGDKIESIRAFNPVSQLSISFLEEFVLCVPSGFSKKEKISFNELIARSKKQKYYIKKTDGGFSVANNPDFTGAGLAVDCAPDKINVLSKGGDYNVFVFASGNLQKTKLKEQFGDFTLISRPLRRGFVSKSLNLAVLGYEDLKLVRPPSFSPVMQNSASSLEFSLASVGWGEHVVHEEYGVGKYVGLSFVGKKESQQDSVAIEFADGGIVNVALDCFDKIHKYTSGEEDNIKLSRLGSGVWKNKLARAKKSMRVVVDDLIKVYSSRQQPRGYHYTNDNEFVDCLADSFPFEETLDQTKTIKEVLVDLDKPNPMDRIVLGDVGFGKTEVALRGAMKVVAGGRQVFFLAPTTILADQHFITSKTRLGGLGVNVSLLSRFQSKKEQLSILEKINNKNVDLVIGTHRLLSKDVVTKNLGLLIIDEEHRFGVKHKERLRILKKEVDTLTLTATPIPRTLQQSLVGVRDISRINTPPKERLPIKTNIQYFSWAAVKQQIKREVRRGGQVYFLHNNIQSLPFVVNKIRGFFPGLVVVGAHGSMPSKDLENTVLSFFDGGVDVLVCTTIIESGLDVTNANTVIINDAHRFGLAQLYQIRGRVGRGSVQAYCWLLIPNKKLNENARKRLKAIEHYSALGSGYQIALKDLEIRGAGSLFGYDQSGHVNQIGYDMYCKVLKRCVDEKLRPEEKVPLVPRIVFDGSAYFSETYIPLAQDRVFYYQRLSVARGAGEVEAVKKELLDRFGELPLFSNNVISIAKIREFFVGCGVKKIYIRDRSVKICFSGLQKGQGFDLAPLQNKLSSTGRVFRFGNKKGFFALVEIGSFNDAFSFLTDLSGIVPSKIRV